ncbi:MAG: VTT domain-containing protein [Polyangiaceae bacterium]
MLEPIFSWLREHHGPAAYLCLGAAAASEYVFPPLPGDTFTLFGVFLAVSAGYSPVWVYTSITAGAVFGGWLAYRAGRTMMYSSATTPYSWAQRWAAAPAAQAALAEVRERFARYGAAYLALNRFLPVLRAFFFVGAGLAGLSDTQVIVWGAFSAMAWNGLLFGLAWTIGTSWERLETLVSTYSTIIALAAIVGGSAWVFRLARARSSTTRGE